MGGFAHVLRVGYRRRFPLILRYTTHTSLLGSHRLVLIC
jgi:hypothetical protein